MPEMDEIERRKAWFAVRMFLAERISPEQLATLLDGIAGPLHAWLYGPPAYDAALGKLPKDVKQVLAEALTLALLDCDTFDLAYAEELRRLLDKMLGEARRQGALDVAGRRAQVDAEVRRLVGHGRAPRQDDRAFIAKVRAQVPSATWDLVNDAIRRLPQAVRRRRQ
jgi:hypothetical protein